MDSNFRMVEFLHGPADGRFQFVPDSEDVVKLWLHPWTAAIYTRVNEGEFLFDMWHFDDEEKGRYERKHGAS